jgi:hypothetical protein
VNGGYQWTQGFWQAAAPAAPGGARPQAEIEYYPEPPQPLDVAPSTPAPSESHFYVPGNWVWRDRYVWRPGCWMEVRPGWIWVPAHYRWTPCGYVFVDGYWDYRLEERGVLFAPVAFSQPVYVRPAYVYTPTYVVSHHCLFTSLFVRRGCGGYYFGDYFEMRYARGGYHPWAGSYGGSGFAVSIGFGRGGYDPLWGYYSAAHCRDPHWARGVADVYAGRYRGDYPRPPRTLVQQNVVVNNVVNTVTTNNTTVVNNVVNNMTMVAPLNKVQQVSPASVRLAPVRPEERVREQQAARELRQVADQRQRLESSLAARNPTPKRPAIPGLPPASPAAKPQQVKLDVPKQAIARSQAPTSPGKAPPPVPGPVNSIGPRPTDPKSARPPASNPAIPARPALPPAPNPPPKEILPRNPKSELPVTPRNPLPPKIENPAGPKGNPSKLPALPQPKPGAPLAPKSAPPDRPSIPQPPKGLNPPPARPTLPTSVPDQKDMRDRRPPTLPATNPPLPTRSSPGGPEKTFSRSQPPVHMKPASRPAAQPPSRSNAPRVTNPPTPQRPPARPPTSPGKSNPEKKRNERESSK